MDEPLHYDNHIILEVMTQVYALLPLNSSIDDNNYIFEFPIFRSGMR
jgi:hypothetical protein